MHRRIIHTWATVPQILGNIWAEMGGPRSIVGLGEKEIKFRSQIVTEINPQTEIIMTKESECRIKSLICAQKVHRHT